MSWFDMDNSGGDRGDQEGDRESGQRNNRPSYRQGRVTCLIHLRVERARRFLQQEATASITTPPKGTYECWFTLATESEAESESEAERA